MHASLKDITTCKQLVNMQTTCVHAHVIKRSVNESHACFSGACTCMHVGVRLYSYDHMHDNYDNEAHNIHKLLLA